MIDKSLEWAKFAYTDYEGKIIKKISCCNFCNNYNFERHIDEK